MVGAGIGTTLETEAEKAVEAGEDPIAEPCLDKDCTLRGAIIGGSIGTVAGVVLGVIGAKEGDARSSRFDVGFYPQRNSGFTLRAFVRF